MPISAPEPVLAFESPTNGEIRSTHSDPCPKSGSDVILEHAMSTAIEDKLRQHNALTGRWGAEADGDRLLGRCKALLLEAEELERALSVERAAGLSPALVGCFGAVLSSLATVSLLLEQVQGNRVEIPADGAVDPGRLLFAISQNLRFAGEAAQLCREALSGGRSDSVS